MESKSTSLYFQIENTEIMLLQDHPNFITSKFSTDKPALIHQHPVHEMFIMLEGELNFFDGTQKTVLKAHDVCIVPPKLLHTTYLSGNSSENAKCISIFFVYKMLKNVKTKFDFYSMMNLLARENEKPFVFHTSSMFINTLRDIADGGENVSVSPINEVKIKNVLSLIFINLLENIDIGSSPIPEKYTKSFDHYIRLSALNEKLNFKTSTHTTMTINQISEELSVSPRHLSNIFNNEYGTSIKNYCYTLRMNQAAFLLTLFPNMQIRTVAENLGYGSSEIFSIMFKRHFGVSASEYRRNHQKEKKQLR